MTLANKITVFRFVLPVIFIPVILSDMPYARLIALLIFLVGTLSDWLDGYVARRCNTLTDFGRLMDPLADKVLISAALICFIAVAPAIVRPWMVVIIISRDFVITGLRTLAARHNTVIAAHAIGKHKTAWQMIGIIALLLYLALLDMHALLPDAIHSITTAYAPLALHVLFYAITLLSLISGIVYMYTYRTLYMQNA